MEITAKIHEIFETQNIKDSFRKREFIAEYAENENYPQYIKFELIQEKCDELNDYKHGDEVLIHFNLRGKPWTNKQGEKIYFNSLQVWKLEKLSETTDDVKSDEQELPDDDLPF
jgi:hypothetical protein